MLADAEDRHDVGMVQPGRRAGLAPEPFQPGRVAQVMGGERLQGDVPPQRFLDRLVDDPHPACSDAAKQQIVTQALGRRGCRAARVRMRAGRLATAAANLLHDNESGKDGANPLGQLGVFVRVFAERLAARPGGIARGRRWPDRRPGRIHKKPRSWHQFSLPARRTSQNSAEPFEGPHISLTGGALRNSWQPGNHVAGH